ncbi:PREDICTED: probable polygalacturonase isoform X1 [Populus euphratica]|uniref:Probable polygalacturonase isoform X1 n=2 Tax=Populus euphratica TaxID=75702 RepID=A0AAJ6TJ52_POPEU|nr:PREDICTED: probable polygalacturonase isoform X1 [Populus euphratica]
MKMPVAVLLLLALSIAIRIDAAESSEMCGFKPSLKPRPHSVSILEFGAVGDGKTLNTLAFQNAIFYLKSFTDKGGAQLYVPPGKWLTGSFSLTSHLTLFVEKGAIILGSQDPSHWNLVDPLPSYGRGIELPGKRYQSLINGDMLHDVVVTGDNGTIDGQGSVWWDWFESHSLNYSRPHLVEFTSSDYVVVSNLTFLNAPAYSIHPVYCSNVVVQNISVSAPGESPYTIGIVPDSSNNVCIEDSRIEVGYDAISLKSGWDEYGITYDRPTTDVYIRRVYLQSSSGSSVAFGSEMSGGISNVHVEQVHIYNSFSGIEFRTTKGRGGYIKRVIISEVELRNINTAFGAIGDCGSHPDDNFDPNALPVLDQITLQGVIGSNITMAGKFTGLAESPFTSLCLFNVSLAVSTTLSPWTCSNVSGFSESVSPEPCPELESSSVCYSLLNSYGKSTDM